MRWSPERVQTWIQVVATIITVILTFVIAFCTYDSGKTTTKQLDVLAEAKDLFRQYTIQSEQQLKMLAEAKDLFNQTTKQAAKQVEVLDKAAELLKQSTTQSAQQVAVLSTAAQVLNQSELLRAREDFNKALDEADGFCSGCPACSPNYFIEVPLDRAVQAETRAEILLSSAEYNRLATLGSSVWEVSKTEAFVKKALARSGSSLDHFFSHLVLGHIYFCHLEKGAELTKVEAARKEFRSAVASLQTETSTDGVRTNTGVCYAIWAAHEGYLATSNYSQVVSSANSAWSRLPNEKELQLRWYATIDQAIHGIRPQISCLFKSPVATVPITVMPPVPNISVSPATAPAPTATIPTSEPAPAPTATIPAPP
ncbi:MAG: hypothetical protein ABSF26_24840 [Thermoguttaceae bacterium]|jgi:hypothetical protein